MYLGLAVAPATWYNERSVINKIFTRKFEAVQGTEVHGTKVPENLQIAERQECYYEI